MYAARGMLGFLLGLLLVVLGACTDAAPSGTVTLPPVTVPPVTTPQAPTVSSTTIELSPDADGAVSVTPGMDLATMVDEIGRAHV